MLLINLRPMENSFEAIGEKVNILNVQYPLCAFEEPFYSCISYWKLTWPYLEARLLSPLHYAEVGDV